MSELLVELFSEEIPARMQDTAARDLIKRIQDGLNEVNLTHTRADFYYTPRRITAVFDGIPAEQQGYIEEIKGPRINAPEQAINGFLKKNNLQSIDSCVTKDINGDMFYCLEIKHEGRKTLDTLGPILAKAIASMTWPKSMRWGTGTVRWARPLHTILAIYSGKTISGTFKIGPDQEIIFGNTTRGHRFLGSGKSFTVENFVSYKDRLSKDFVLLDQNERRDIIWRDCQAIAEKEGLTVKQDDKLLNEIVGIVEYPIPFIGAFPEEYLSIPPEVISTTMRENQRYFTVLDASGKLTNRFICVANIKPDDDGKTIIHGNEKVLRARLSDARFFWDQDRKANLESYLERLKDIRFHEKLGSVYEKTIRVEKLSGFIADQIGADKNAAARAGKLCKADLATGIIREFPELQGIMGGHYARVSGESDVVENAISSHYSPAGPNDDTPSDLIAISTALADKLDTIVGFFSIGEKPTGSKDPFALRRAALGIIRLITENNLHVSMDALLQEATNGYNTAVPEGLMDFIQERFRVKIQSDGIDMKIIDAVLANKSSADLTLSQSKIAMLSAFLKTQQGAQLSALVKRTINILKTVQSDVPTEPSPPLFVTEEEKNLHSALNGMQGNYLKAMEQKSYQEALGALAGLYAPIQAFFDKVMVMDENTDIKNNRIALIQKIPALFSHYADFKILSE